MTTAQEFGKQLRIYRERCKNPYRDGRELSRAALSQFLEQEYGIPITGQMLGRYERGQTPINKEYRDLLIALIATFARLNDAYTFTQADTLLSTGNYRRLNAVEAAAIKPEWEIRVQEADVEGGDEIPKRQPYKGLGVFKEVDADLYFGRTPLINQLNSHITHWYTSTQTTPRFHAIIGASGSGKSSLVRAGLRPQLPEAWHVHLLRPTDKPLDELATKLASIEDRASLRDAMQVDVRGLMFYLRGIVDKPTLIVIDQFEELFTLCDDQAVRQTFIDNLLTAATIEQVGVLITLRADFYQYCLAYNNLLTALTQPQGQTLLGSLSTDDLEAIIKKPAELCGYRLDPGLSAAIVDDCMGRHRQLEPTILPLLSMALFKTWENRSENRLTLAGYQAAGWVQGAIAQEAKQVFTQFTLEEQSIARQLFLELTAISETTDLYTRRHVPLSQLIDTLRRDPAPPTSASIDQVFQTLLHARLITIGDDANVAITHEALIQRWEQLRTWLADNREWLRFSRQLERDAQTWQEAENKEGLLYRGIKLQQAEEKGDLHKAILSATARTFLTESRAVLDREAQVRIDAERREREQAQALAQTQRSRVRVAAALSIIGIVLAIIAFNSAQGERRQASIAEMAQATAVADANARATSEAEARSAQQSAEQLEIRSRSQALAAQSQLAPDPHLAMNLAIGAFELSDNADTRHALQQASKKQGHYLYTLPAIGDFSGVGSPLAWHPNEALLLTANGDTGHVIVWDGETGEARFTLYDDAQIGITFADWNRDGSLIVVGSFDGMRLWDAQTGERLALYQGLPVLWAQWNADETQLALIGFGGQAFNLVAIWDRQTATVSATLTHDEAVHRVAWRENDQELLVSGNQQAYVWDVATNEQVFVLTTDNPDAQPLRASWSDDEQYILTHRSGITSGQDNAVVWNATTGERVRELTLFHQLSDVDSVFDEDNVQISDAFWLHDSHHVLLSGVDNQTVIWDIDQNQLVENWRFGATRVEQIDSNNRLLLLTDTDMRPSTRAIRIWDTQFNQVHLQLDVPRPKLGASDTLIRWNNTQTKLAVVETPTNEVHVFALVESDPFTQLEVGSAVRQIKYGGRTDEIALIETQLGELIAWDSASQTQWVIVPRPLAGTIQRFVNYWWRNDGTVWVAYEEGAIVIHELSTGETQRIEHPTPLVFAHGHDVSIFVTVDEAGIVRLWDSTTRTITHTLAGHAAYAHINLSGTHVWTHAGRDNVRLWDALTGELRHELPVQGGATVHFTNPNYLAVVTHPLYAPDGLSTDLTEPATLTFWDVSHSTTEPFVEQTYPGAVGFIASQTDQLAIYTLDLSTSGLPQHLEKGNEPLILETWDMVRAEKMMQTTLPNPVIDRVFSQAGDHLFIVTEEDGLLVFDVMDGALRTTIPLVETAITAVAFGQTKDTILLGTDDGLIQQHFVDGVKLTTALCQQNRRNLTVEEWAHYFPDKPYQTTCDNLPPHPSLIDMIRNETRADEVVVFFEENVGYQSADSLLAHQWDQLCQWGSQWEYDTEFACANLLERCEQDATNLSWYAWLTTYPGQSYRAICANQPPDLDFLEQIQNEDKAEEVVQFFRNDPAMREAVLLDALQWNNICWWGTVWGYYADVTFACEHSVSQAPTEETALYREGFYRGALGVNLGFNGDLSAALTELTPFIAYMENWMAELEQHPDQNADRLAWVTYVLESRRPWVEALQNGENPFDVDLLLWLQSE